MKLFFAIIVCIACKATGQSKEEVDYYERLVKENLEAAFKYTLSGNAHEFEGNYFTDAQHEDFGSYDFIVVGSGSTGGALAARLSEVPTWKILLIEAGKFANNFTNIPAMFMATALSDYNWGYTSTPQENACQGTSDKTCGFPRGKVVGGSSSINCLFHSRGVPEDFDLWSHQVGGGWSYKEVLPYFNKIIRSNIGGNPYYYGRRGPIPVNYIKPIHPQAQAFLDANVELGRKVVKYNGKFSKGVSKAEVNNFDGKRVSTGNAYVIPAMRRKNFRVLTEGFVTKVLVESGKVYGVAFMYEGKKSVAKAGKEVLLCGGVFGSASILLHSGFGPKEQLKKFKIPLVKDLPVGENLRDHVDFYGLRFNSNYSEPEKSVRDNVEEYLRGEGRYTAALNAQTLGFYETKYSSLPGAPDVEVICSPASPISAIEEKAYSFSNETLNSLKSAENPKTSFMIQLALLKARSSGQVTLKTNNPFDYPFIDPKYLTDEKNFDAETIFEGIQLVLQLLETKAFKKLNVTLANYTLPACSHTKYLSKAYWMCTIKQISINFSHLIGTCRMGKDGVVDKELKVHGVKNLRVADASVFRFPFSGHTSLPAIMVGEKLADMIKKEYRAGKTEAE